jgi:hypothetical protein
VALEKFPHPLLKEEQHNIIIISPISTVNTVAACTIAIGLSRHNKA